MQAYEASGDRAPALSGIVNRPQRYDHLSREELIALVESRSRNHARIGLNWAPDHAERDRAFNDDFVSLRLDEALSDRAGPWENLIIEGDNFDALRWLRMTLRGRVKCIVVDPPYNTGGQSWAYNDRYLDPAEPAGFGYTTWLEFLHRRFALARDLLTEDGVILVNINDENRALLELMLDQTLPGMKIGSLVWRSRTGGNDTEGPFLSLNHEHVLVYANPGFRFGGTDKSFEMYRFYDAGRNDHYRLDNLTQPKDFKERPNGYYPLYDSETGIFYPANPSNVWRYTSVRYGADKSKLKTLSIEDWISKKQIQFPLNQKTAIWKTKAELLAAIASDDVPKSGTTPRIWADMPDLDFWIGKTIGFGTPAFRRYKSDLKNETQPLSSWITPTSETKTASPGENALVSGTNDEGTKALKAIFGAKVFNYPKPLSLVRELIRQASAPGDIVLDFFAGSATTAHAVMELNAEDAGDRRFIMISHDEATENDRNRNICRDVTAKRIRLLNETALKTGKVSIAPFAYLRTHRRPIDALHDAGSLTAEDVWLSVQAIHGLPLLPIGDTPVQVHETDSLRVIYIHDLSAPLALETLARHAIDPRPVHVYTWTPALARDALHGANTEIHRLPAALTDRFAV